MALLNKFALPSIIRKFVMGHVKSGLGQRPIPSVTFRIWRLFGVTIVALLLSAGALSWGLYHLTAARTALLRSEAIERGLRALGEDLLDAETGQRSYLLTTDERDRETYQAGVKSAWGRVDAIRRQMTDAAARKDLDRIVPLVSAKLDDLQKAVTLLDAGQRDAAVRIVAEGTGQPLMNEFRNVRSEIIDARLKRLNARRHAVTTSSTIVLILFLGAATIMIVLLGMTRRATRQLGASHSLLERTGAIAGVGGWEFDLTSGSVTWSDQTCLLHDVEPGHRPSIQAAMAFYRPQSRLKIEQAIRDGIDHGVPWDMELEFVSAKQRVFWARATGAAEFENGRPVRLLGAFQDVTEMVQARQQLKEKTENLEATLQNINQGIVKVTSDRRIEFINRRFAELQGIPLELIENPSPHFDDVLAYLDARGEFDNVDEVLRRHARDRGRPIVVGTHQRTRPNGVILEVVSSALSNGSVVTTYSDVTARRLAEMKIRESEARYRSLAEATSDVITQLDLDLICRYASPACRAMLGHEPEEMVGTNPAAAIHPEDAPMVDNVMQRLVAGQIDGDKATTTSRMRHKDGHWVWLEAGINLVRDPDTGEPRCLICSLRDVTERQRAAQHLREAKQAAEEAALAKSEFVANMSHELRTPLTGIMGVHDVLRADPTLSEAQRRLVSLANEAGRSLLTIVNDILDLSKIEAGQLTIDPVPFDLRELIESCGSLAKESLDGKPVAIATMVQDHLRGSWIGDPVRLRQILMNLLSNAVKFTQRGIIEVAAFRQAGSGLLRVEVIDTGIGIPPDRIERLFERFTQADASVTRRFGGTGLGLAISKRLLDLMNGRIGAEARPQGGSLFWFELPLGAADPIPDRPAKPDATTHQAKALNILLAEDNILNSTIVQNMLAARGYRVTIVGDGQSAVQAAQGPMAFDVILMDIQMPVLDGLTATATIRKLEDDGNRHRIPIVGLTANAMVEDVERSLAAGMELMSQISIGRNCSQPSPTVVATIRWSTSAPDALAAARDADPRILNETMLDNLARIVGRVKVAKFLETFAADLTMRIVEFARLDAKALASQSHSLRGLAAQLGFVSLASLCQEIEMEAMQGKGVDRIAELEQAVTCAIEAAAASSYAQAA